jgi:hypothetical protein
MKKISALILLFHPLIISLVLVWLDYEFIWSVVETGYFFEKIISYVISFSAFYYGWLFLVANREAITLLIPIIFAFPIYLINYQSSDVVAYEEVESDYIFYVENSSVWAGSDGFSEFKLGKTENLILINSITIKQSKYVYSAEIERQNNYEVYIRLTSKWPTENWDEKVSYNEAFQKLSSPDH